MIDHSKYEYTKHYHKGGAWHIDNRHIELINQIALSSPKNSVLCEVGCCKGASTTGFIDALQQRPDLRLHLFEPNVLPELTRLIQESGVSERVTLFDHAVYTDPRPHYEVMFIDGNHGWPALADLAVALTLDVPVIMLHDTQFQNLRHARACEGSILAAQILKSGFLYRWYEDSKKRVGEETDRGFLVAYKKEGDWVCSALPSG